MSTIKSNNKFGKYYQRKINEGKHHMLVVNNLRNKLVITAFGCIIKGEKYQEDYEYAA
jgi:transposase